VPRDSGYEVGAATLTSGGCIGWHSSKPVLAKTSPASVDDADALATAKERQETA